MGSVLSRLQDVLPRGHKGYSSSQGQPLRASVQICRGQSYAFPVSGMSQRLGQSLHSCSGSCRSWLARGPFSGSHLFIYLVGFLFFLCIWVFLTACMSVHHIRASSPWRPEEVVRTLRLELQVVVSCHGCAGNRTQVLCRIVSVLNG